VTQVAIENVDRRYGNLHVLKDVSLDVREGEFAVLLGPSGCGKSTLLASIAGLDPLEGGRILFDGEDVSNLEPAQRNIGMVFQSYALYPSMRVRGNLSFGLESQRLPRAEVAERVARVADLLQIDRLLDRRPAELSGGQRQRVAIGRALVRDTSLFLFDEPLSNLDAKLRTEMRVELKALHQRLGATFIYVTHDQVEAMTLATRIAVMNGGRVEQYAPPEEVYERPASTFVASFIGSPPMNLISAVREEGSARVGAAQVALSPRMGGPRDVLLGIRPESLALAPEGDPRGLPGRVLVTEPLGSDTLVWVEVEGQRVAARVTPREGKDLPEHLSLVPDPEALCLFDRESGQRIVPGVAP
jgi:multiple sugar transport system ATP-binding protein